MNTTAMKIATQNSRALRLFLILDFIFAGIEMMALPLSARYLPVQTPFVLLAFNATVWFLAPFARPNGQRLNMTAMFKAAIIVSVIRFLGTGIYFLLISSTTSGRIEIEVVGDPVYGFIFNFIAAVCVSLLGALVEWITRGPKISEVE